MTSLLKSTRISLQKIALEIELLEDSQIEVGQLPIKLAARLHNISSIVSNRVNEEQKRDCNRCGQTWKYCEC